MPKFLKMLSSIFCKKQWHEIGILSSVLFDGFNGKEMAFCQVFSTRIRWHENGVSSSNFYMELDGKEMAFCQVKNGL